MLGDELLARLNTNNVSFAVGYVILLGDYP
jgi:hypothetical protein